MAESPPSMNRTSSLEHSHSGGFSEAMFYLKRAAVLKRKAEPGYSFCQHKHYCKAANRSNKIHCDCGETRDEPLAWHWDRVRATQVTFRANHVVCHETLSTGTALLLGDTPLEPGGHHFFEVKLLTDLYGTDTMIGLCTDRLEPSVGEQRFVSLLGSDQHSWGFSYHGKAQHAGAVRTYGAEFGKGSIVGVYANLRSGHLEFFLNRRSLGVAFTGLPCGAGERLYPAFCTTAANTCVRLVTAVSVPDSLQFQATAIITRSIPRWSLSLPAPICRLVRRFAWLEYRQPHLPATGDDAVMLLDDSPAQQTSRPLTLPPAAASEDDAPDSGAGGLLSICGAVGVPLPPAWYLDDDDSPPAVAVVSRVAPGVRGPPAVPPPARRLRLYVSPDELGPLARGAAADGERPGDDASPPLRTPVALVTLVPARRGRRRRRSSAAAPLSRPPVDTALSRPPADAQTPTCSDELLNVAMVSSPDEPEPELPTVRRPLPDRDSTCHPMPNGDSSAAVTVASGACRLVALHGRSRDTVSLSSVPVSVSRDDANGIGDQSAPAVTAPLGSLTGGLIPPPSGPVTDVGCDVSPDVRVTDDLDTAVVSDKSGDEPSVACGGDKAVISDMANGDSKVTSDADTAVITDKSSGESAVACGGDTAVISEMPNCDSKVNCDGDDVEPTVRCDGDTAVNHDASHTVKPTITCGGNATAAVDVTSRVDIKAPCDRNTSAVVASQPSAAASRVTVRRGRRSSVSGGTAAGGGSGGSDMPPAGTAAGTAIRQSNVQLTNRPTMQRAEDQSAVRGQGISSGGNPDISHSTARDNSQLSLVRCDAAVQPVLRVVDTPSPAESPILGGRASAQQTVRDAPPSGLESAQQGVRAAPLPPGPERPRQGRRVSARLAVAPLPASAVAGPGAASARDSRDGTRGGAAGAYDEDPRPSPQPGTSAGARPSLLGTSAGADGKDRRCFTIAEESSGDIASSVKARRRSVAVIAGSSAVAASTKTRRRSAAVLSISTSDTATNVKTRRRSTAVFSIATSDVKAASPKTRRRSAVPNMGGSEATKAAVGRRRSALPSTTSTDVAVDDVKTTRRSALSTERSTAETVPVSAKARRRSTAPSGSSDGIATAAAMDTTGRRRSVVPTPSTSSSDAAADLRPTRGRRLSLVPSEGSTDAAADAKTRRRSAAPSTGSSDLATAAKGKRRSAVPTEVASELAVPAKNRRRSAAPAVPSGTAAVSEIDATAKPTRGRRLSLATSEGSTEAIDVMKTRRRSAAPSVGISELTAAASTRRRSALPSSEDTSDVAVPAKTRRRSVAVPSDIGSDAAASVKSTVSRRRSAITSESTSHVAVPAKTRRRSAVPIEGAVSDIAAPVPKTRRRSAAPSTGTSSDVETDASTLKRRSAVSTEDSSDVAVPTSSRRRWSVAVGSDSDADSAKIRLRLVVDADTDSDAKTVPAKTRRRSAAILSESSSDIVVPAAKTRRRSAIGIQSSDDVAEPVKRRRHSAVTSESGRGVSPVVASEGSGDVAAEVANGISSDTAVKTRRRSSVGSGRNSDATATSSAAAAAAAASAAPSDVRSLGGTSETSATAELPPPAPETVELALLGLRRSSLSDITTGSGSVSSSGSGSVSSFGASGAAPRRLLSLAFGPGPGAGAGAGRHSAGDTRTERTERRARRRSLCPEELAAELSRSGRPVAPAVRRRMSRRPPGLPVLPEESTDAEWSPPAASAAVAVAREEQWGW